MRPAKRQKRSPARVCGEISKLLPKRIAAPTRAKRTANPSTLVGSERARINPQKRRITLPALPKSVALPKRVKPIPICQLAKSIAKAADPMATNKRVLRGIPDNFWPAARAKRTKKGKARNKRQKAALTGPVSDNLTNHGPSARAIFPAISAQKRAQFAIWIFFIGNLSSFSIGCELANSTPSAYSKHLGKARN